VLDDVPLLVEVLAVLVSAFAPFCYGVASWEISF